MAVIGILIFLIFFIFLFFICIFLLTASSRNRTPDMVEREIQEQQEYLKEYAKKKNSKNKKGGL